MIRRAWILMLREWALAFESLVAVVVISTFVLALAGFFFFLGYPIGPGALPGLWRGGQADLSALFAWLPLAFVLLVPALTMGAWARERAEGVDELLLTFPLRVGELVLGKFVAIWALVALLSTVTILPIALSVDRLGPLDWSTAWVGLGGAWLLAAALVALSLFVSAWAEQELVAYVFGVLLLGGLWLARMLVGVAPAELAEPLAWLAPGTHFLESFARGVVDARDAAYFALATLAGLSLNAVVLERRRGAASWRLDRTSRATASLAVLVLVLGNLATIRHLHWRRDFSADRLLSVAPVTRRAMAELEDELLVETYFSGSLQSGESALAKARLESMLDEYAALADGRMRIERHDPSHSSRALAQARELGIEGRDVVSQRGTQRVREVVHMGAVLRYRGRESVLPFLEPRSLELAFTGAVHQLAREERPRIGWWRPAPDLDERRSGDPRFQTAMELAAGRGELVRVEGLEYGRPVPADLDVLIVAHPIEMHPRAAFEIDQYVQRGGPLLAFVDCTPIGADRVGRTHESGLESVLGDWNVHPTPQHVWDDERRGIHIEPNVGRAGKTRGARQVAMPLFLELRDDCLSEEAPATAGLVGVNLHWAQPIPPGEPPAGVRRDWLLRSSENAYRVDPVRSIVADEELIAEKTRSLYALGAGRRYDLAVSLEGPSRSSFEGRAVPAPAPGGGSWLSDEERARAAEARVVSGLEPSRVVVIGDVDWMRDVEPTFGREFFTRANQALFGNLLDWATQDEALLELRARAPRDRGLVDFDEEERRAAGLMGSLHTEVIERLEHRRELEAAAAARASRRRLVAMGVPAGATLLVLVGASLSWTLYERRRRGLAGEVE